MDVTDDFWSMFVVLMWSMLVCEFAIAFAVAEVLNEGIDIGGNRT